MSRSSGSYLLVLYLDTALHQIEIGRFGAYDFSSGYYIYVGSAMGSGGLSARLAYHQRLHKAHPHWHIDYLRPYTRLLETWTVATSMRLECNWCHALTQLSSLSMPVRGFGSRDTGCPSHLFYSLKHPSTRSLTSVLLNSLPLMDVSEGEVQIDISTYETENG